MGPQTLHVLHVLNYKILSRHIFCELIAAISVCSTLTLMAAIFAEQEPTVIANEEDISTMGIDQLERWQDTKCRVILAQLVKHAQKGTMWFWGSFSTVDVTGSEHKIFTNYGCHRKLYFFRLSELTNLELLYEIEPKLYHPSVSLKKKTKPEG